MLWNLFCLLFLIQENLNLNKRMHEMAGQMIELRSLLQAVRDENERLSISWQSVNEVIVYLLAECQ